MSDQVLIDEEHAELLRVGEDLLCTRRRPDVLSRSGDSRDRELLSRADNNGEGVSGTEFERTGDVYFRNGLELAIGG